MEKGNTEFREKTEKDNMSLREKSRGSSGNIVSDYGLDDRGSIPERGRGFFF
jgi:hypothetical protein